MKAMSLNTRGLEIACALLAMTLATASAAAAATLRVPSQYPTIQAALDVAGAGDTVLVAPGEYVITRPLDFNRRRPEGAPVRNIVLVSEAGPERTVIRMAETPENPQEASVVVFRRGEGRESRLEGFTLTGGRGTSLPAGRAGSLSHGGGIHCAVGVAPVIRACRINGNEAHYGGGLSAVAAAPLIEASEVSSNQGSLGGGVYATGNPAQQEIEILDCTLISNQAPQGGSAIRAAGGALVSLSRSTLAWNRSVNDAATLVLEGGGSARLSSCIVWGNGRQPFELRSDDAVLQVEYSLVEGGWPGVRNLDVDPRFCGWDEPEVVHVGGGSLGAGDGSSESPFLRLGDALEPREFRLALSADSPCRGAGAGGEDMGAPLGVCDRPGERRTVRLAAGSYDLRRPERAAADLLPGLALEGAGAERTLVVGGVRLWDRALLRGVTVAGSISSGVLLVDAREVRIADCKVQGNGGSGVSSLRSSFTIERCDVRWNTLGGLRLASSRAAGTDCLLADNGSGAIALEDAAELHMQHSTVAASGSSALTVGAASKAALSSSILWGHGPVIESEGVVEVSFSAVQGGWTGAGNIASAPRFCGWAGRLETYVDPLSPTGGNGSPDQPYAGLVQALASSYGLAEGSPCRGAGEGGSNMGAARGDCLEPSGGARRVHLAPGRYWLAGAPLPPGVSLIGAGREETLVEGKIRGLETGAELRDLTLTGAWSGGGLVIEEGTSPRLLRCAVRGARSYATVYCGPRSAPVFEDCVFSDNDAGAGLGAVIECGRGSRAQLTDCRIERNHGAGLRCLNASPVLLRVVISGNMGTGVECHSAAPVLRSCRITGNSGRRWGGVSCIDSSAPLLEDCLVAWNAAGENGGALFNLRSHPVIRGSTLAANASGGFGSGIYCVDSSPSITSSILWQHPGGSIELADESSRPRVSYSLLEEPWPGEGNIAGDPRFCGYSGPEEVYAGASGDGAGDGSAGAPYRELAAALDYRFSLAPGSPCLGAGAGGADIGAALGSCAERGAQRRTVLLAPGAYSLRGLSLASRASLLGAGADATIVNGAAIGLRQRERLSRLAILGAAPFGILIAAGESPLIEEVVVDRSAGQGVICAPHSAPHFRCVQVRRSEENGVVCGYGSSPRVESSSLIGNAGYPVGHGLIYGGNLFAGPLSEPRLSGCKLLGATGSGIYAMGGAAVSVERSVISANRQSGVSSGDSSVSLADCLLTGHQGTVIVAWGSRVDLLGVTMASNRSSSGTIEGSGELVVENSIIWGNTLWGALPMNWSGEALAQSGSILEDENPLFVDPGQWDDGGTPDAFYDDVFLGGDFRLQPGSPAIDRGDLALVRSAADLDGAPRVCGKSVDLGAYEAPAGECREVPEAPGGCLELPPLAAAFTLAPESGLEPLEIAVDASGSTTAGLEVEYRWDFGDGSSAAGERASHTYRRPGRFTLRLIARDQHFRRAEGRREVTVLLRPEDIAPWTSRSRGEPPAAGADGARRDGPCLLVAAAGSPLASGQGTEQLRFVHREIEGDLALAARIDLEAAGSGPLQTGLMLRESAAPGAPFVALVLERTPGAAELRLVLFHRGAPGEPFESSALGSVASAGELRLRLSRRGAAFLAAVFTAGGEWQERGGALTLELPPRVLAGIAAAGEAPALGVCPRIEGIDGGLSFRRGDTTADGRLDITDAVALLGHLFLGAPGALACRRSADADDSGRLEITDAIHLLGFLFLGGPPPPAPFPDCGFDSTHDTLDCERYPPCD
jgi:hypothetical protein